MQDTILHPLSSTTIENQEWVNQFHLWSISCGSCIQSGSFQSVCLDESVYITESNPSSFDNNCVLHMCNMKKQAYYKLPTKVGYVLAEYCSKVVLIGGEIPRQRRSKAKYPENPISVLNNNCGLEERLNSALQKVPEELKDIYKIGKKACAVGDGDLLIVIGGDGPHKDVLMNSSQEYARVFDGHNWSHGVIGVKDSIDIRSQWKTLLIFQNHIYMTASDESYSQTKFYHASLKRFRCPLDQKTSWVRWRKLKNIPDSQCTNLSVLGNQLVTLGWIEGGRFGMYAYLPKSSMWIAVQEFQIWSMCSSIAGIIGLQSSNNPSDQVEALVVGCYRDNQLTKIIKVTTKCKSL